MDASGMVRQLPNEVVDQIIDFLRNNHAALIACSQVSHQWLPRSRRYIFQHVHLTDSRPQRLLDMIHSGCCFINPNDIREVTFTTYRHQLPMELCQLLSIARLSFTSMPSFHPIFTSSLVQGISTLNLSAVLIYGFHSFYQILSSIRTLQSLELISCKWYEKESEVPEITVPESKPTLPSSWSSIVLDFSSLVFTNWMLHNGVCPSFSCLHVLGAEANKLFWPNWTRPVVCTSAVPDYSTPFLYVSPHAKGFKHIHIPGFSFSSNHLSFLGILLLRMSSDVVETITIQFVSDTMSWRLDWSTLEKALLTPRLRSVKSIEFQFFMDTKPRDLDEQKCFASPDLRRKLSVSLGVPKNQVQCERWKSLQRLEVG